MWAGRKRIDTTPSASVLDTPAQGSASGSMSDPSEESLSDDSYTKKAESRHEVSIKQIANQKENFFFFPSSFPYFIN
jgi:hypothetical protein